MTENVYKCDASKVSVKHPRIIFLNQMAGPLFRELAEVLEKLAGDSELRATLGQNGRRRVMSKYLASVIVPQLEILLALIDKGNKGLRHEL